MHRRVTDDNFRIYITDCLYGLCAAWGNPPRKRYYDLLHAPDSKHSDGETAQERLERLGIKVVD